MAKNVKTAAPRLNSLAMKKFRAKGRILRTRDALGAPSGRLSANGATLEQQTDHAAHPSFPIILFRVKMSELQVVGETQSLENASRIVSQETLIRNFTDKTRESI